MNYEEVKEQLSRYLLQEKYTEKNLNEEGINQISLVEMDKHEEVIFAFKSLNFRKKIYGQVYQRSRLSQKVLK